MRQPVFPSRASCRSLLAVFLFSGLAFSQSPAKLPMVAVMPLTAVDVKDAASNVVTDALADELLKTGKVRVMERAQMETILKEQGFSQSGACDGSECAVQVGKLLSIDRILVGTLGQIGSSYSLSVRAVDVSTGEILGSSRRQQKGEIDEVTTGIVPAVAKELANVVSRGVEGGNPAVAKAASGTQGSASPGASAASEAPSAGGSRWGWWLAGGAVVAGGAVAAVLLAGSSGGDAPAGANSQSTTSTQTLIVEMP